MWPLVRILALVACLFSSGFVGVAYLAAWIGILEETWPYPGPYPGSIPEDRTRARTRGRILLMYERQLSFPGRPLEFQ